MLKNREILKIGLAVTAGDRLLVVKKKGGSLYILPGGKPEAGENDIAALAREIEEELGCHLDSSSLVFLGSFSDVAADLENTIVTIRLYAAQLLGDPAPKSEIENLKWFSINDNDGGAFLAPSLQNQIVPFLYARGHFGSEFAKMSQN
jgi:8-oxo-dGTP diphosphatase